MNYKDFLIKNFRGSQFSIYQLADSAYFDPDFPTIFNKLLLREYIEMHYPHMVNEFESSWKSFIQAIDSGRKSGNNRKSIAFSDTSLDRIKKFKDDNGMKTDLEAIHALVLLGLSYGD